MSMEKITKEELLKKLGGEALSDDELEIVIGGKPASSLGTMGQSEAGHCTGKADNDELCHNYVPPKT